MKRGPGRPPEGVRGMRVRDYPQLSIRMPPRVHRAWMALRRRTGFSNAQLLEQAEVLLRNMKRKREA